MRLLWKLKIDPLKLNSILEWFLFSILHEVWRIGKKLIDFWRNSPTVLQNSSIKLLLKKKKNLLDMYEGPSLFSQLFRNFYKTIIPLFVTNLISSPIELFNVPRIVIHLLCSQTLYVYVEHKDQNRSMNEKITSNAWLGFFSRSRTRTTHFKKRPCRVIANTKWPHCVAFIIFDHNALWH